MTPSVQQEAPPTSPAGPLPLARLTITGVFMGLANLIPGVSGGTMVLALGLYREFIGAVSEITRLRFAARPLIVLAVLFGLAAATILGLAGVIEFLLETFKPGMLALFVGMTLGGAPMLYRQLRPINLSSALFAGAGLALMAVIAFGLQPDLRTPGWGWFFAAGLVGSSAMILPGISGSYLLLVLGLYLPVISGISDLRAALTERDISQLIAVGYGLVLPVGLGLVAGVVALSNLLKFFLERYERPTTALLLGLLLGAVLGLYPFQDTSLDRLPRYAVSDNGRPGEGELRIIGFGWEQGTGGPIERQLQHLPSDLLEVEILETATDRAPTVADVQAARETSAVIIAYDVRIPREVRQETSDRDAGRVPLYIVPDTELTFPRGVLALFLAAGGFLFTFSLGRLKNSSRPPATENPPTAQ